MSETRETAAVTLTIDGKEVTVPKGTLIIRAAEQLGVEIPRFCDHPYLAPVGACRQCYVEVEGQRKLFTSCTTEVAPGMAVRSQNTSDEARAAQVANLEFLLLNHPLDCPICDRGGECPLQDQAMAFGPGESRFTEPKRTFAKPIDLSPLVALDRERCVLCARCTRFCDEISGDRFIELFARGAGERVSISAGEDFRSPFSGNTVQICPVGALTATPYRFKARPWDLEAVESTCPHCSVGCRVSVQASHNEVVRLLGVDVEPTNQGWLCDKGRFGYEYLRSPDRLTMPLVRGDDGRLAEATWADALDRAASGLEEIVAEHGAGAVAGIGGARSTNEEAYAFARFLRAVIGTGHLDSRVGDALGTRLLAGAPSRGTIDDLERARTVLVWAPDLKEELPVLYLRVRRAATELGATLVVVHPRGNGLDADADHVVRYRPGEGADLLARLQGGEGELEPIRAALDQGPVVAIVGRTGLTESPRLAEAVAAFAARLPEGRVLPVARRGNLYGAIDMGVAPDLLPGRVPVDDEEGRARFTEAWGALAEGPGLDCDGIIDGLAAGSIRALVLLGADPAADHPALPFHLLRHESAGPDHLVAEGEGLDLVAVVGEVGHALVGSNVIANVAANLHLFLILAGQHVEDVEGAVAAAKGRLAVEDGGGAVYNLGSSPTFIDCEFIQNHAESNAQWAGGGAMRNQAGSSPTLTGCLFLENTASGPNLATSGGMASAGGSYPQLTDCRFIGNSSSAWDGAAASWDDSGVAMHRCEFRGNSAVDGGADDLRELDDPRQGRDA